MSTENDLPILTAYYENDFGDPYSAFLTDDPKISSRVDCEVVRAEDYLLLKSERDALRAELDKLKEQKPVGIVEIADFQTMDVLSDSKKPYRMAVKETSEQSIQGLAKGTTLYAHPVPPQQDESMPMFQAACSGLWYENPMACGEVKAVTFGAKHFILPQPEQSPAVAVPSGWKLVPIQPTIAMFEEGHKDADGDLILDTATIWQRMLDASPAPPSEPQP